MFDAFRLLAKVLFAPIWLLWKLYLALWWAFDDSDELPARPQTAGPKPVQPEQPGPVASPRQGWFARLRTRVTSARSAAAPADAAGRPDGENSASFCVVDSRPARRPCSVKPLGLLRSGFAATLALTILGGIASAIGADAGALTSAHAWTIFAWVGFATTIGSLFCVRSIARKRREMQARRYANIKAAWACAKDGCAAACTAARKAANAVPTRACGRVARACAAAAVNKCSAVANRAAVAASNIGKVSHEAGPATKA